MLEAQHCIFWTLVMETSLFADSAYFPHSWITEQPIVVWGPLWWDANSTESVLFKIFFSFVLFIIWPGCVPWLTLQRTKRIVAHSGQVALVSWKRHFLCIMRNFGYSWLTDMRIFFGRVLDTGTENTLKMSYIGCFSFSFCQLYMVKKRRHYSGEGPVLRMFHGLLQYTRQLCTFWTIQIIVSGKLCLMCIRWIWTKFDYLASLLISGSVYTERVFCFPDVYSYGSRVLHDWD